MRKPLSKPERPRPIISRYKNERLGEIELIPTVELFHVQPMPPKSTNQESFVEEAGPLLRIIFSNATYDYAWKRGQELHDQGNRVEFIYAVRDVNDAIRRGDFTIKVLHAATSEGS